VSRQSPVDGVTADEYYDEIGLAVLDVATANSSKGFMGLAELISRGRASASTIPKHQLQRCH